MPRESEGKSRSARPRLLIAIIVLGVCARLVVLFASRGSNDIAFWWLITQSVKEHGLLGAYQALGYLNHPPAATAMMFALRTLSDLLRVRSELLFKLPGLVGEALAAWLLFRRGGPWRLAAFAVSPLSILISSFHGNTDPLYAALLLAAALALDAERPFTAGALLALSLQVKLIPLLVVPALLLSVRDVRAGARLVAGLSLAVLPFLPLVLWEPTIFLEHVLGYSAGIDLWGISGLLALAQAPAAGAGYLAFGKWVMAAGIVATVAALRWRGERSAVVLCAAAMAVFLALTPGFGVQYLAALVPLLFAADWRWAVAYSIAGGTFVGLVYLPSMSWELPMQSMATEQFVSPAPAVGIVAWAVCVGWCVSRIIRRPRRAEAAVAAPALTGSPL